jgi:hypothetical protein
VDTQKLSLWQQNGAVKISYKRTPQSKLPLLPKTLITRETGTTHTAVAAAEVQTISVEVIIMKIDLVHRKEGDARGQDQGRESAQKDTTDRDLNDHDQDLAHSRGITTEEIPCL